MIVKPTVSKYKIDCGAGGIVEENLPLSVVTQQDLQDFLNNLGIGTFSVTGDALTGIVNIAQVAGTCHISFFIDNKWTNCNLIEPTPDCVTEEIIWICGKEHPIGTLCTTIIEALYNCPEMQPQLKSIEKVGNGNFVPPFMANQVQVFYSPPIGVLDHIKVVVNGIGADGDKTFFVEPFNNQVEPFKCATITSIDIIGAVGAESVNIVFKLK